MDEFLTEQVRECADRYGYDDTSTSQREEAAEQGNALLEVLRDGSDAEVADMLFGPLLTPDEQEENNRDYNL